MTLRKTILAAAVTILLFGATATEAARYEIESGDHSEIVFKSKAPLEKFDGKTKQLTGFFEADLADLSGAVTLEVEVDLASFDTGKKKRNRHMCENHLETDTYRKAWFRAGEILSTDRPVLGSGDTAALVVGGTLDLHGVEREYEVALQVTRRSDDAVVIHGEFMVSLNDHAIKRPKFLVMKLADEQRVVVDLLARPVASRGGTQ
jgi:polyisoprenoid-binding protein YceI